MKSEVSPKLKNFIISIFTTLITILLILIVIFYDPNVKNFTVQKFSNSTLTVDGKYVDQDTGDTYLILKDLDNDFTVTIRNSVYYDSYQTSDEIIANRYAMIHDDGTEEVVYYFTEQK